MTPLFKTKRLLNKDFKSTIIKFKMSTIKISENNIESERKLEAHKKQSDFTTIKGIILIKIIIRIVISNNNPFVKAKA